MSEARIVGSLALLYTFRMLGLFMVLPILMLYGNDYIGASPAKLGLALGIYGLTQAVFQIPMGLASDIMGRKIIISAGLLLFAAGSLVAALSDSAEGLIIGRALQGSGAIASTIMATVADLTSEENRTKAMASIGASIGVSFSVAMIAGPSIAAGFGLSSVFYFSAVLSLFGLVILYAWVPSPNQHSHAHRDAGAIPGLLGKACKDAELLRLYFGIFCLHAVLMASFVAIPLVLSDSLSIAREKHWLVYLPTLVAAFIIMLPFIIVAEKKRRMKWVFVSAVGLLVLSEALLSLLYSHTVAALASLLLFFIAFNLLEATLPSLVSKITPAGTRGTAMGVYSSSQFLGAFVGGVGGGLLVQHFGVMGVFIMSAALLLGWFCVALFMRPPRYVSSLCVAVKRPFSSETRVNDIEGVEDVLYDADEGLLYLKIDRQVFREESLAGYRA